MMAHMQNAPGFPRVSLKELVYCPECGEHEPECTRSIKFVCIELCVKYVKYLRYESHWAIFCFLPLIY